MDLELQNVTTWWEPDAKIKKIYTIRAGYKMVRSLPLDQGNTETN